MPPEPIRLPAAMICMSFMETPPSASAPMAASDARSTTSLSACLPNFVIVIPRIHTFSAIVFSSRFGSVRVGFGSVSGTSGGLEAEADRLGAVVVGAHRVGREADLHPEADLLGVRVDVDDVAAHA